MLYVRNGIIIYIYIEKYEPKYEPLTAPTAETTTEVRQLFFGNCLKLAFYNFVFPYAVEVGINQ